LSDTRGTSKKDDQHSPFAEALFEALQNGEPDRDGKRYKKADYTKDGVITATELALYLRENVETRSGERQTPGLFPLKKHDRGEYIFHDPNFDPNTLSEAPELDENNNPYRGLKPLEEEHARFFFGRQELIEQLYTRITTPDHSLTVVLGVSGSGKSSLVKAGLIPYLRQDKERQWQILAPIRPGDSPFASLARSLMAIANTPAPLQLNQMVFLNENLQSKHDQLTTEIAHLENQGKSNSSRVKQLQRETESLTQVIAAWNHDFPEIRQATLVEHFEFLYALCQGDKQASEQQQLNQMFQDCLEPLTQRLQSDSGAFLAIVEAWVREHQNIKLLLVIDQFEELITLGRTASQNTQSEQSKEWQQFLNLLATTLVANPPQLRIIITLRSDFEPRFVSSETLKPYWAKARFPVRPMRSDELRQAIEGPASEMALYFEPANLVDRLIDEVGQMPGSLSLLSFTLSELYIELAEKWRNQETSDRALTIDAQFDQEGGVAGSLTRKANEEYQQIGEDSALGEAGQQAMRRVMLRMVILEGGETARRRVPISELVYPTQEESNHAQVITERLVNARLVVRGQLETGESYIEPAHDFLVRGWDKLQGWIKREIETSILQQRLTVAANDWEKAHRDPGLLIPDGDRLKQFAQSLKMPSTWFNLKEKDFIEQSLELTKKNQIRGILPQRALKVLGLLPTNPVEALVLAIQITGENLDISPEEILTPVKDTLIRASNEARESNVIANSIGGATSIAVSSNGQFIISGNECGTLQTWDWQGNSIHNPFSAHKGVNAVAISPDNQLIASGGKDQVLHLWDVQGNPIGKTFLGHQDVGLLFKLIWMPRKFLKYMSSFGGLVTLIFWIWFGFTVALNHGLFVLTCFSLLSCFLVLRIYVYLFRKNDGAITTISFTPNGKYILSGGTEGGIRLWSLRGQLIRVPFLHYDSWDENSVNSVISSPNGRFIASAGGNTVRIWNFKGESIGHPLEHDKNSKIETVTFSPDGKFVASGGSDKTIRVWSDWEKNSLHINVNVKIYRGHEGSVTSIAFSPDGKYILSGSDDKTVRVWNVIGEQVSVVLGRHEGCITSVAWHPGGHKIISSSDKATMAVKIWEWQMQGRWLRKQIKSHESRITAICSSPNGEYVVSGSEDGVIRIWNKSIELLANPVQKNKNHIVLMVFSLDSKRFVTVGFDSSKECHTQFYDIKGNPLDDFDEPLGNLQTPSWNISDLQSLLGCQYEYLALLAGDINHISGFSPNGKFSVTCAEDGIIHILDDQDNLRNKPFPIQEVGAFQQYREYLNQTTIEFDDSWNSYFKRTSLSHNHFLMTLQAFLNPNRWSPRVDEEPLIKQAPPIVTSIALSPDAQWIASGYTDGMVKLWNFAGELVSAYKGHEDSVTSILFSMSGSHFLSLSEGGTLALWSQQGYLISNYQNEQSEISSFAISPDGYLIFCGLKDGTLQLWEGDKIENWLEAACDRLRYHPVFKNSELIVDPKQREIAISACQICQKYIWSREKPSSC
jgi:WD40 repeat protein